MSATFPVRYRVEISKLRQQLDEAHFAYWKEREAAQPTFTIENIRFRHVEGWNRKIFSIQSAHDANHWIWKATRVVWVGMGGSI